MEHPKEKRLDRQNGCPINYHLFNLMTIAHADLSEQQRERLAPHLTLRGVALRNYNFLRIRTLLFELFGAPRSSLEKPSFRPTNQQRTFYSQDYGDLDGSSGYWATEEETGQAGFVQEFEDTFWVHDEASDAWVARHFKGGRRLIKGSRKRKRKASKRWKRSTLSL